MEFINGLDDAVDGRCIRTLASGKASDSSQSSGDLSSLLSVNGKNLESWRTQSDPTIKPNPSQRNAHEFVSQFRRLSSESENVKGAVKVGNSRCASPVKANLGCSGQGQIKRGFAFPLGSSMLFSFVSIYILIGMLGARNPRYNLQLVPSLGTPHRPHRRIQEAIVLDPFKGGVFDHGSVRTKEFPSCDAVEEDSVPCYNSLRLDDRHCERGKQCLIPPPNGYKIPPRWPRSRDNVWHGNMKFTERLRLSGSGMARLKLEAGDVVSLDMEQMTLDGLDRHVQLMEKVIGNLNGNQDQVHTVLDIDCGLSRINSESPLIRNAIILCLSPYEVDGSQVQFSLERGLPAVIGSLIKSQFPFPYSSFDMIHCLDCNFHRIWKEDLLVLELDRLLKPGGIFASFSSQVATAEDVPAEVNKEQASICWSSLLEDDKSVFWQKAYNRTCYYSRSEAKLKPCGQAEETGSSQHALSHPCISGYAQNTTRWKDEAKSVKHVDGFSVEEVQDVSEDSATWSGIVKSYWSLLSPLIFSDHPKRPGEEDPLPPPNIVRNVMDMNALHGSLNVALLKAKKSVWVMNVVPRSVQSLIFARGLIGIQHDWCEPFPTYPRTYDLLHGIGLLSQQELMKSDDCGLSNLLLEMNRILRPEGWVILRDTAELIGEAREAVSQMKWESRVISVDGHEGQLLLVCQKPFLKLEAASRAL